MFWLMRTRFYWKQLKLDVITNKNTDIKLFFCQNAVSAKQTKLNYEIKQEAGQLDSGLLFPQPKITKIHSV